MEIIQSIFNFLKKLLKKIWEVIKKVLPIILLALAVYCLIAVEPLLLFAGTGYAVSLGGTAGALLALGASFLVAPQESAELVAKVGAAVGDAISAVGSAAGDVAGSLVSGFFSSPLGFAAIALGAFWLLTRDGKRSDEALRQNEPPAQGGQPYVGVNQAG